MHDNLITIIIPCYNQAYYLGDAIESALRQTHDEVEIIVVDDGSTDNTSDLAAKYPGVKLIRQINRGLSAARNTGLCASKGKYLVFLDADDRLLPEALESGLKCIVLHPDSAFVYGGYMLVADERPPARFPASWIEQNHYLEMLKRNFICMHATVLYKRNVFNSVSGFDPSLKACEDYDLYFRILKNFPAYPHERIVAEYRRHGSNMSSDPALMLKTSMAVLKSQWEHIKADKEKVAAYEEGIRNWQKFYGPPLVIAIQNHMQRKLWEKALMDSIILFKNYPEGILRAFLPKTSFIFSCIIDSVNQYLRHIKRSILFKSTGFIKARPWLISIDDYSYAGETTLSWESRKTSEVEVHIDAPDGPLLSRSGPSGAVSTGKWVRNGMFFYLQDVSGGLVLTRKNTLAVIRLGTVAGKPIPQLIPNCRS